MANQEQKEEKNISINFIDGPFVEIKESIDHIYRISFINLKNNKVEFEIDLKSNSWAKANKKYYGDWLIKIEGINTNYYFEHSFNVSNRRVLISFESKALGDTLAWFPYVEKFRIDKKCEVICSTFHNYLFKDQYPEIQFVEPGSPVNNIYALYRIGYFINNGDFDAFNHPTDPRKEPLTKAASDILGLDFVELKPKLPIMSTEKKEKQISIAIHSTAQCKYWNNPNGWQDVVDFLKENGYEVILLSKEPDGYMGNKSPNGVKRVSTPSILDALKVLQESKLFIGIGSGLSWLSWAAGTETILISGFTDIFVEQLNDIRRVINEDVCHGCWSKYSFDPGDWNWCPVHKGTDRQFECSKMISSEQVINEIKSILLK